MSGVVHSLAGICLLFCFASCSDVIDLQDLLRDVSSNLASIKSNQLKINGYCGPRQEIDYPQDCQDIRRSGKYSNGVYLVQPLGYEEPFEVYCDMITDGGGWTVIQRRGDFGNPVDYFYNTWKVYKEGFGHLRKEFWLGNDKISALSLQRDYELRVDLHTLDRQRKFAKYSKFWVDNERNQYKLHAGGYSGNAGDSLIAWHSERPFSTKDRGPSIHCANQYKGGWWYKDCHASNLNGLNLKGTTSTYGNGIVWAAFMNHHYSLYSEMKIR